jgi:hypothetical protein
MAFLPLFRRILREDLPDAPDWVNVILSSVNKFFESTIAALNRALTFQENFNAQIKSFRIVAGANPEDNVFRFASTMTVKPQGLVIVAATQVDPVYVPITAAVFASWRVDGKDVVIDAITGLIDTETYDLRVLVF